MKEFLVAGHHIYFEEITYEGKEYLIIPQKAKTSEKQRIRGLISHCYKVKLLKRGPQLGRLQLFEQIQS
jgi:hypothetical protein